MLTVDDRDASLVLEQQVCFALSIAARAVVATYRPLLEPLGLTHPQYLVMVCLWQHGSQSVKQLGSRLMLDSGTLSPLVKRLENMGLVRRSRGEADERLVIVTLTPEGARLRRDAEPVHDSVVRRIGLDDDQLARLQQVLSDVIESVGAPPPRS